MMRDSDQLKNEIASTLQKVSSNRPSTDLVLVMGLQFIATIFYSVLIIGGLLVAGIGMYFSVDSVLVRIHGMIVISMSFFSRHVL